MKSIAAPKPANKLLLFAALLGSAATAQQPAPPTGGVAAAQAAAQAEAAIAQPAAIPAAAAEAAENGPGGSGLALLNLELETADQARVAALIAGFDDRQRAALDAFLAAQPEGDRGAFMRMVLGRPATEQSATLVFLASLDAAQALTLAEKIAMRQPVQWPALPELLGEESVATAQSIVFSGTLAQDCAAARQKLMRDLSQRQQGATQPEPPAPTVADADPACSASAARFSAVWSFPLAAGVRMELAPPDAAPWQVQLFRAGASAREFLTPLVSSKDRETLGLVREDYERLHICGGVWLGDGWVLTAAHCIGNLADWRGRNPAFFDGRRIRIGTNNIGIGKGQVWPIVGVVRHGGYVQTTDGHDIALLRLGTQPENGAPDRPIKPAALPGPRTPPPTIGQTLRLTGWGMTGVTTTTRKARDAEGQFQRFAKYLRVGALQLARPDACTNNPNYRDRGLKLLPGQICAGSRDGVDACKGDSGGPLVWLRRGTARLVGLVSYGPGCGLDDTPGVYTDVHFYRNWIAQARQVVQPGRIVDYVDGACRHDGVIVPCGVSVPPTPARPAAGAASPRAGARGG